MCEGGFEIPVWVDDTQKCLSGLSKRTTCDDIIYAILYNENRHETDNTDSYAIFECWKGVEKCLQGRTKILRVWRNWGPDQAKVQFLMRRVDDIIHSSEYSATKRRYRRWRHRRRYEHNYDQSPCKRAVQGHYYHKPHTQGHIHDLSHSHSNTYRVNCAGLTNGGNDVLDHEKLRRLQKTIRLVMNQEKKIKSLANRLEETELLIEKYEAKIHYHRMQKKGVNYVQRSLLLDSTSTSEDSLDDFISKANLQVLEEYVDVCDRLIAVCELLAAEQDTIEQLSSFIRKHGGDPTLAVSSTSSENGLYQCCEKESSIGSGRGTSQTSSSSNNSSDNCEHLLMCLNHDFENSGDCITSLASGLNDDNCNRPEIEAIRIQFNRVMTVNMIQNITLDQLDRELQKYDLLQKEKIELIQSLEKELEVVELSSQVNHQESRASGGESNDESNKDLISVQLEFPNLLNGEISNASQSIDANNNGLTISGVKSTTDSSVAQIAKLSKVILISSKYNENNLSSDHVSGHRGVKKNITGDDNSINNGIKGNDNDYSNSSWASQKGTTASGGVPLKDGGSSVVVATSSSSPRVGSIAGGAYKNNVARTKSKRDWTVLTTIRENGIQEKLTFNHSLYKQQADDNGPTKQQQPQQHQTPHHHNNHHPQQQQQPRQHIIIADNEVSMKKGSKEILLRNSYSHQLPSPEVTFINCGVFKLDKSDDTDSTSDTGLGSMHSDEFSNNHIETLV